jgi:hypothetical protein
VEVNVPVAQSLSGNMVPGLRVLGPRLFFAAVLPVIVYNIIRPHLTSDAEGLLIVTVFPIAVIVFERVRAGRFEPIGIISLIGIVVGVVAALAFNGSTLLLKVRSSLITGIFGAICLGSLASKRPVMWYMGRAFATRGDRELMHQFDTLWAIEGARQRFVRMTRLWGVALVVEAVAQVTLALTLTTGIFLAVSLVVNGTVLVGLIVYTTGFVRRSNQLITEELAPEAGGSVVRLDAEGRPQE